ncbi:MAG TPA: hypothetical protein VE860_04030 [Chthoniobacterales bacterium]|jgi:hypothetical protein|nr:hypothetical protein [Chthoniobacterales bacterium]
MNESLWHIGSEKTSVASREEAKRGRFAYLTLSAHFSNRSISDLTD